MLVTPLGSGSGGNCYYFESDGTRLLVDAGFGPRETEKRLNAIGRSLEHITAMVITHEHHDHIRGADRISRKFGIPIYLTAGTLHSSNIDPIEARTMVFKNDSSFQIGEFEVHACRTIHDASDPACFVLEARDGTRVGLASDLGTADERVRQHLSDCDGLFFESNHDLDMLRNGGYPWSLKRRIMSKFGHLSNDDAMFAVRRMIGGETKTLCMIHLSEMNNHPSIVHAMARSVIESLGARIELQIAKQDRPLSLLEIARRRPVVRPVAQAQLALF